MLGRAHQVGGQEGAHRRAGPGRTHRHTTQLGGKIMWGQEGDGHWELHWARKTRAG